ncbi:MAG: signal peptidase I [Oscillospiraceae bacterium]|nr:signal peptidase I [Oscillospiraceae bacterium]
MNDESGSWRELDLGDKTAGDSDASPDPTVKYRRQTRPNSERVRSWRQAPPDPAQISAQRQAQTRQSPAQDQSAEHEQSAEQQGPEKGQSGKHAPAKKKKRRSPIIGFLVKLVLLAAILYGVFTFVLGMHICHGNRMHPFIMDGDLIVTYKLEAYHVGDAVVYESPLTGEKTISRIAAIGENEIQITDVGELLINGSIPEENVFYATKKLNDSTVSFPYRMSGGGYFLLDDYRTIGKDSRMFGEVTEDALLGKIVYVFRRRGI